MNGDYTRSSFKREKRYSQVNMQQGRPQLDADWNEQGDIVRERVRLLSLDNFGAIGVPYLTTPDAFLIGHIPGTPPNLSIEPGRLYVDGLLAELFEAATYSNQPFLPDPPPLAGLPARTDAVAYLDVWERELTYIEDPEILDMALGGVDTATRLQTVWQLRVAPVDEAACGLTVGAPPSGGRLTTDAVAPPVPDDPCILPPIAGYRGLENRLYRVEIQSGGPLGAARFKWSRDNGSLVSAVTALAVSGGKTTLTVNRIGRDDVMRFRVGDWVTVTDDYRELHGEAGEMAKIDNINEADREIVLDRVLPASGGRAFAAATDIAARHTRIQRWDTAPLNPIDGNGLIAATGPGPIDLEAGIRVTFSTDPAGGQFRVGDHWLFWARTATATVEKLTAAPPRGIQHHYVQLAAVSALGAFANQGGEIEDCRPPAPAEGCCSFVVKPGKSIQAAIDALPDEGGCVCLRAGLHLITEPIYIFRDNVTLHGESLGAIVDNPRSSGVVSIEGANHVRIQTIVFRQVGATPGPVPPQSAPRPAIEVLWAKDVVIDDCRIETSDRGDGVGVYADGASDFVISGCAFLRPAIGVWLFSGCNYVTVSACEIDLAPNTGLAPANVAILGFKMDGPITAENNTIRGSADGIIINDTPNGKPASPAQGSRICGNRIRITGAGGTKTDRAHGIDVAAAAASVNENQIEYDGAWFTAIRLCGTGSSACGNWIKARASAPEGAIAIWGGYYDPPQNNEPPRIFLPIERLAIVDNVIEGSQSGITLTGVARSRIAGNLLGGASGRIGFGISLLSSPDCIIAENVIARATYGIYANTGLRTTISGNRIDGGGSGIVVIKEESPTISGNRLTGLEQDAIAIKGATERCHVIENRIIRCGALAPIATGLSAADIWGELHVEGNEVMDVGIAPGTGAGAKAPLAYGIDAENILEARIESNLVTYSAQALPLRPVTGEDRALRLRGSLDAQINDNIVLGFAAQITNNKFIGPGNSALVELWERRNPQTQVLERFERVLFHGNYCMHYTPPLRPLIFTTGNFEGNIEFQQAESFTQTAADTAAPSVQPGVRGQTAVEAPALGQRVATIAPGAFETAVAGIDPSTISGSNIPFGTHGTLVVEEFQLGVAAGSTVVMAGRNCSITGNHVKATTQRYPSYDLRNKFGPPAIMRGPFIGNVSHWGHSGRLTVANGEMPFQELSFNTNA